MLLYAFIKHTQRNTFNALIAYIAFQFLQLKFTSFSTTHKVMSKAIAMQNEIDFTMGVMHVTSCLCSNLPESPVNIAMITIGVSSGRPLTSLACLDDNFVRNLKADERFEFTSLSGHGKTPSSGFTNSRTIRLVYQGVRKYILVFVNGSFQVTGCKKVTDATLIVGALLQHMGLPGIDEENHSVNIRMFNTNFKLGCAVNLEAFHKTILATQPLSTLDKQRSSGVNVPVMVNGKKVVAVVFPKGNVICTGANHISQVSHVHEIIVSTVDKYFEQVATILLPDPPKEAKKRGRKRKADVAQIYDSLLLD